MDTRIALASGTKIGFPGMCCTIESLVGKGSNAIVYRGWYPDLYTPELHHTVLIKELFPYHPFGYIYRDESGNITVSEQGDDLFEPHKKSFEDGNKIHLKLLEQHPEVITGNINTISKNNTLYTILDYDAGRSLDSEYTSHQFTLKECALLINALLDSLNAFHDSGYLHLDISPDNILLIGAGSQKRVTLIDFNSVHKINVLSGTISLSNENTEYCSIKAGFTAPEVKLGIQSSIGKASDMYSVAAVFYYLLTGTAQSGPQILNKAVPDLKGSKIANAVSETVGSMLRHILRRGFAVLPEKRYRNVSEMQTDIRELLDRIDGFGITHWALWESSRRNMMNILKLNPSMSYLMNDSELYPLRILTQSGGTAAFDSYIADSISENKGSFILNAAGGMGKTTALLHTALRSTAKYSPLSPVAVYIYHYTVTAETARNLFSTVFLKA